MPFLPEKPDLGTGLAPAPDMAAARLQDVQNQADRFGLALVLVLILLGAAVARIVWVKRRKIAAKADSAALTAAATGIRSWREMRGRAQKFSARATDQANRRLK